MRPLTAHISNATGINLEQSATNQTINPEQIAKIPSARANLNDRSVAKKNFGSLYDGFVGVTEEKSLNSRLTLQDLEHIKKSAIEIDKRISGHSSEWLPTIKKVCDLYIDLLNGDCDVAPKHTPGCGLRHSIVCTRSYEGVQKLYEMTNSMSELELARLKRKTSFISNELDNAPNVFKDGQQLRKISLGSGNFGTTRIARDIETDTFVAVKKSHPKIGIEMVVGESPQIKVQEPMSSGFGKFSNGKIAQLKNIRRAVVLPQAELVVQTKTSDMAHRTVASYRSITRPAELRRVVDDLVKAGMDLEPYLENPLFVIMLLEAARSTAPYEQGSYPGTLNTFSELGLTTVEKIGKYLNYERYCFESSHPDHQQQVERNTLLTNYIKRFYAAPTGCYGHDQVHQIQSQQGANRYASPDFRLKDTIYNIRFQNTLGKKMLEALAAMHEQGFSHQDIKPDNIVLCLNSSQQIVVKLIDMDFMTTCERERELPNAGCLTFMPPEAKTTESDGSVSYAPINGDSFAMGMTIRSAASFSMAEISLVGELQRVDRSRQDDEIAGFMNSEYAWMISRDTVVQTQKHVAAKMKVTPELLMIKDIADTMLARDPGKRQQCRKVLKWKFFSDPAHILSDQQFTDHALRIVRFGVVASSSSLQRINDEGPGNKGYLPVLRRIAKDRFRYHYQMTSMCQRGFSSLQKADDAVSAEEKKLNASATCRQAGRSMMNMMSLGAQFGGMSIADKKLAYNRELFE